MSQDLTASKKPMPYTEVRKLFSEARQKQLRLQGPITDRAIQVIQESRKYAHSPILAAGQD